MKLITKSLVILTAAVSGSLSACTTVDLTQIAVNQPSAPSEKMEKNVVERASLSLTSMFHAKGWCQSDPARKTRTATSILLNGINTNNQITPVHMSKPVALAQIITDMTEANFQVKQATKAAEIYLVTADDMAILDNELSQLEAALLSSREAQASFVKTVSALPENSHTTRHKLADISKSIDSLKNITDAYGDRIRARIAVGTSSADS